MIPAWIVGQRLVVPLRRLLGLLDKPSTGLPLPPPPPTVTSTRS